MTTIYFEENFTFSPKFFALCRSLGTRFALVCDAEIAKLFGEKLQNRMREEGLAVDLFSFPPGEVSKCRAVKERLEDEMIHEGHAKDSCLIAMGGGVALDLAGFLASTYCRGIPLLMVPTTLLAMVDAAIGGKNGVNVAHAKNWIGTIYPPSAICIDPLFLRSLPKEEWNNGKVEMLKHGLVADRDHFEKLVQGEITPELIKESIAIKLHITGKDEWEVSGLRRVLNFGHTIGHALEKLFHYAVAHGKAVAYGILVETFISEESGYLSSSSCKTIVQAIKRYVPKVTFENQALISSISLDKKALAGKPRFVLLEEIGRAKSFDGDWCTYVEMEELITALKRADHVVHSS